MPVYEELLARLEAVKTAPFLFIGAGLSHRYLQTDGWEDLLRRMAAPTGKPYAYFATRAGGSFPKVASEIAIPFHELWWTDPAYKESRDLFGESIARLDDPLKVEVARYTSSKIGNLPLNGDLGAELDLLREAVVDGLITTNYDTLLERLFPDFPVYVGQEQLLFSEVQGIAEIYKIHGSAEEPPSLVLTDDDYTSFNDRNPYLAAKLLTIFIEHPILFLGYSLSDPDVTEILVSVAKVLTTENLSRLQGRLYFVQWNNTLSEPTLSPTQIAVEGFAIPVVLLEVPEFAGIFGILGKLTRHFPAKLLRQLKEQVYDLVLHNQPTDRISVIDIDSTTPGEQIEFVMGVGIREHLGARGLIGLHREDLLLDVLRQQSEWDPRGIVEFALPEILRLGSTSAVPIYRYLREGGYLRDDGTLIPDATVDSRLARRVADGASRFAIPSQSQEKASRLVTQAQGSLAGLVDASLPLHDLFLGILALDQSRVDLDELRTILTDRSDAFHGPNPQPTAWGKAVALYDYWRFGPLPA